MYTTVRSCLCRDEEVPYTAEIDIWSVGCIFAELMTAYLLFGDETEMDVLYVICKTYRLARPPQVAGGHPTLGLPGVQEGGPAELPPGKVVTSASRGDSRPWLPSSGFWMPPSGLCIQAAVNQSPSERECIKPPKRMCDTCHTARQPTPPLPLPSVRRSPVSSPRAHPLHAFQSPAPQPRAPSPPRTPSRMHNACNTAKKKKNAACSPAISPVCQAIACNVTTCSLTTCALSTCSPPPCSPAIASAATWVAA
jgi:serine/threonine protein kinase